MEKTTPNYSVRLNFCIMVPSKLYAPGDRLRVKDLVLFINFFICVTVIDLVHLL